MTEVLKAGVLSDEIDLGALAHNAAEKAEEFVIKVGIIHRTQLTLMTFIYEWMDVSLVCYLVDHLQMNTKIIFW